MSDTRLILHVKGTEAQTTELPRRVVRAAISKGQITHSQLIWSPTHNAWKQVREMPDLLMPSQRIIPPPAAAIPVPRVEPIQPDSPNNPVARAAASAGVPMAIPPTVTGSGAVPRVVSTPATGTIPKIPGAKPATGTLPKIESIRPNTGTVPKVAGGGMPASFQKTKVMPVQSEFKETKVQQEEEHDFHPVKWICIILGALILIIVSVNFIFVDLPLNSKLAQTSYGPVKVYGHLGAFFQPNVLVIHIPASSTLTSDNMADFLSSLAHSTPRNPVTANLYDRIALSSAWTAQYSFSGSSWKQLGEMSDPDERKDFILGQIADASGAPLVTVSSNPTTQEKSRDSVWNSLVARFSKSP